MANRDHGQAPAQRAQQVSFIFPIDMSGKFILPDAKFKIATGQAYLWPLKLLVH
jgi:hypothetical protein